MKKYVILILFLVVNFASSQNKKTYYYDSKGNQLTEDDFYANRFVNDELTKQFFHFENDTSYISIFYPSKKRGKLKQSQLDSLKVYLNSISSTVNTFNKYLLIHYRSGNFPYEERKTENTWEGFKKYYWKKLKKKRNPNQFWVYKDEDNIKFLNKGGLDWIQDKYKVIGEFFFPFQIPHGGFLVIKSDGHYICSYNEYNFDMVWDVFEELETK